jgi:hypothetical protein
MIEEDDKVLDFWNERATLVEKAGARCNCKRNRNKRYCKTYSQWNACM